MLIPDVQEKITRVYQILYQTYKPQGWWPLVELQENRAKPEKFPPGGYHPDDYSFPKNRSQRYEICLGAILTQNTSWSQVAKILKNLYARRLLDYALIKSMPDTELGTLIKSSGYYHQKAKKIKIFSQFFSSLNGKKPERKTLLNIWGIGPETADSILLYAYKEAVFVIDSYTRRIFNRILSQNIGLYDELQFLFHHSFKEKDLKKRVNIFNEYHSLLVYFAKNVCKKNPDCEMCRLADLCGYYVNTSTIKEKYEKEVN